MKNLSLIIAVGVALLGGGCGSRATTNQWKSTVEAYLETAGSGDLTSLRNLRGPDGRNVITAMKGGHMDRSTDVIGVVLGPAMVDAKLRYIFLVAVIDRGEVEDMRVASLGTAKGRWDWDFGDSSSVSLSAYRRARPTPAIPIWPYPQDVFELTHTGGTIVVTERGTGVHWTLDLNRQADATTTAPSTAQR